MTDWRDQRIAELEATVAEQKTLITQLMARIEDLEARLNKNSHNSSTPSSANPPNAPPPPKKKGSGRKRGGQPGHRGAHRANVVPDEVMDHFPGSCRGCGESLIGMSIDFQAHQVADLPPVCVTVTEHRLHRCRCSNCGKFTKATLPPDVPSGQFGPRLTAAVAMLSGRFRLTRREMAYLFEELFGGKLSVGSVQTLCEKASEAVASAYAEIQAVVLQSPFLHADETSFRHRSKKNWLWATTCPSAAFFRLHAKRGYEGLDTLIPETYPGTVISDRWAPYKQFEKWQVCHAHLLRNWTAISERKHPEAKRIGNHLVKETERLLLIHRQFRREEIDRPAMGKQMRMLMARYARFLDMAAECGDPKTQSLGQELNKQWEALWTFVTEEGVDPTNNEAERQIRPAVLWRKGSLGTQSQPGQWFVERSLSVAATAKKQGLRLFGFLTAACEAPLKQQAPPSLFACSQHGV